MSTGAPYIIPFFISHQGCPHQCVFCNQEAITGEEKGLISGYTVREILGQRLSELDNQRKEVEVAFYGGSFTGIPEEVQEEILGAVQPFLAAGLVKSIRLSTRPDYIDRRRAAFLRSYGVATVELGVQSLDHEVLVMSGRGHTRQQVEEAFDVLQKEGFKTGGQLMIGLPGDNYRRIMKSCLRLADLAPDMVRIYPALVLKGSPLARLYRKERFSPLPFNKALAFSVKIKGLFDRLGIPVIRMGLHPSSSLENGLLAGPYHPAFGELVKSRIFFHRIRRLLVRIERPAVISLSVRDESVFRGQKNCNLKRLEELGLLRDVQIEYSREQARDLILVRPVNL
ncbi:MAG: elongator complex protein 3 [Thermodesulfobacteriota bacterium]